jgi:ribosome-associated translation inhibitor RaiA
MMQAQLTFHGLAHDDSAEAAVLRWIARIEQFHDRVTCCGVVIGRRRRSHEVMVRIDSPDLELTCTAKHENIYIAIADAFRSVRRQLAGASMEIRA